MEPRRRPLPLPLPLDTLFHLVHEHFLWLLLGSYVVAGFFPGLGLMIRHVSLGQVALLGTPTKLSLPMLMLAFLLFNAGIGVQVARLRALWRSPVTLLVGLVANLVVPVAFILGVSLVMRPWHNPDEVQHLLVGLALIASMPIAGSSTAWSQNANGDLALSLGLILGSTLLSPLTTPLALHAIGFVTTGDYSEDLHEMAASGTGEFLALAVIVPSLLGIAVRLTVGEARTTLLKPWLRLFNSFILLLLNYSNASLSLPQTVSERDWDFLAAILAITVGLCSLGFGSGWAIARLLKVDHARRTSLMFGLGMNNNGTGLVLASMALTDHPGVMPPIIVYNLVQHLVAGVADWTICRPGRRADTT
jgi:BASS family bile acid:Na+ symporter